MKYFSTKIFLLIAPCFFAGFAFAFGSEISKNSSVEAISEINGSQTAQTPYVNLPVQISSVIALFNGNEELPGFEPSSNISRQNPVFIFSGTFAAKPSWFQHFNSSIVSLFIWDCSLLL